MRRPKDYWENVPSVEKSLSKSVGSIGLLTKKNLFEVN